MVKAKKFFKHAYQIHFASIQSAVTNFSLHKIVYGTYKYMYNKSTNSESILHFFEYMQKFLNAL